MTTFIQGLAGSESVSFPDNRGLFGLDADADGERDSEGEAKGEGSVMGAS
jgi:hypothetical protein